MNTLLNSLYSFRNHYESPPVLKITPPKDELIEYRELIIKVFLDQIPTSVPYQNKWKWPVALITQSTTVYCTVLACNKLYHYIYSFNPHPPIKAVEDCQNDLACLLELAKEWLNYAEELSKHRSNFLLKSIFLIITSSVLQVIRSLVYLKFKLIEKRGQETQNLKIKIVSQYFVCIEDLMNTAKNKNPQIDNKTLYDRLKFNRGPSRFTVYEILRDKLMPIVNEEDISKKIDFYRKDILSILEGIPKDLNISRKNFQDIFILCND